MSLAKKSIPQPWVAPLREFADHLRAANQSPNTIGTRDEHLRRLARNIKKSPWQVTAADLEAWVARFDWSPEYRKSIYNSIEAFYNWAERTGKIKENPANALPSVKIPTATPRPIPHRLYRAALAGAEPRARLILRLAAEAGLRRGEIAQIHRRDIIDDLIGESLIVHGKGGKTRIVPLPNHLAIELRNQCEGDWAFPSTHGGHLSPRHIGKIASRILPAEWTLHSLRHRFATDAYAATRDLLAVQKLLGHTSPTITQRYVDVDTDRLRAAVNQVAELRFTPIAPAC